MVLSLTALSVGVGQEKAREKTAMTQSQVSQEVQRLIGTLEQGDRAGREKAAERLLEIGQPAISELKKLGEAGESIDRIIRQIQEREVRSEAVVVQGASFAVITDRTWKQGSVKIWLEITNLVEAKTSFYLLDTVRVVLHDPNGQALRIEGGRDITKPGRTVTPALAKGDAFIVSHLAAKLAPGVQGSQLQLAGSDGFGGTWSFHNLSKGKHRVGLEYRNTKPKLSTGEVLWTGSGKTPLVEVEIK